MSAGAEGLRYWRLLFGERGNATPTSRYRERARLDRASLPTPATYLSQQGLMTGKSRGEWVSIRCPAHKSGDEAHPSMRVSLVDGHYFCHACAAKGGDVIALHRLRTGLGFRAAVTDLGGGFDGDR